ncbi:MAG: hypothetical protein FJ387_03760 [Verrucomicrobia bacterium]|nr:hypothetical protein [Verrucomicrobiota bacterium]
MKTNWLVCSAVVLTASLSAQEIGYLETFSLATDRETALRELVPGTDDYFYYHALQAQSTAQRERFQEVIDRWIRERNGQVTDAARELLNRQALLDYERDPQKTLEYLREQLDLRFDHARKTGERRSDAPSQFDNALIRPETLLERALAEERGHLERLENGGLELVARSSLTGDQRRNLLARLQRPDYPGLVDLIVADLKHRDSRGFGSLEIHKRLTLAQLEDLIAKEPGLRNQTALVNAYLPKLAPPNEVELATDPEARQAYLERVWAFAKTLDPVHNSLKAHVLYHRLRHDQQAGVYDRDRFLEYVKLPRDVYYLRDEIRQQLPRGDHLARLDRGFGLLSLPTIANEEPLVRDFLAHFFHKAANYDEYRPWIRDDFLKRVFAESKIVQGVGDPQQWAPLLAPEEYQRLKERVDLEFAPDNPDRFGIDAPVQLAAFVKHVAVLIVKVYEINTLNYYRQNAQPLNLALNLDGLVASFERRFEYSEPPERRVRRTFDFPELDRRGAYVIELIGNGKSSRALVQKGWLGVLQEVTPAGHAFTVLDEAGRRLADARAWLAGREFTPGPEGRILVAFTTAPKSETLVVYQGGFAWLVRFEHLAETYELNAGIYVDRESLIRREKAQVIVRPVLRINGRPTSLELLEEPRLVLQSVDLTGIATAKELSGLNLREDAESVSEFLVPENAVSLTVTLKARIQNLSQNRKQNLAGSATFTLNGIERSQAVQDLHVSRTQAGYVVELRGKNGEPRPGEPLACAFKHRWFREEVHAALQTDPQGRAWLGPLAGIERFRIKEPAGREHTWVTARGACAYPAALHGRAGETLRVPLVFQSSDPLKEMSLLEVRGGQFVRDWHDALALDSGFIELRDLPAGDYSLFLEFDNREIAVRLTQGEDRDGFTGSPRRALERPRLAPLQVSGVAVGADAVEIQLAHATAFTRVHILASRYLPAYDLFAKLGFTGAPELLEQKWRPAQTFYESGRDIGDEYRYILDRQRAQKFPGNMLERPGLLLNPWARHDTDTQAEFVADGTAYASRAASLPMAAAPAAPPDAQVAEPPEGYTSLDFLQQPAVLLLNLVPEKNGHLRILRLELKGKPHLRILAVDPLSSTLTHAFLEDSPLETRELRLVANLDPAQTYAEQKRVTPLPAQGRIEIADVTTSRFETYDTVAKAYRLLATLSGNPTFAEFDFVARWPDLSPADKQRQYSKYACHELSFFLFHKDSEFFRAVVAPYLANKKDKTFLDRWLLNQDLEADLEPWRFGRLNAFEQILLSQRLRAQRDSLTRDVRERAELIPPNLEDSNRRFDTAVQTSALETDEGLRGAIRELRQEHEKDKAVGYGLRPASAAAAPVPPPVELAGEARRGIALALADRLERLGAQPKSAPEPAAKPVPAPEEAHPQRLRQRDAADLDARLGEQVVERFFAGAALGREQARRFFQKLDSTKEWAENNYYHLPIEQQLADLVTVNEFWADYARHDGTTPFLSPAFPQATRNFTEMMLALAVLDLPFAAGPHQEQLDGRRYALEVRSPAVVFHREIRQAAKSMEPGGMLVAQHFFRADDRYLHQNNERFDKYVTDEFLPHVVYGAQVVLTNPTGNRQKLEVLLEIPRGAIPVNNGFYTRGVYVALEPYSTQTLEYSFYFPVTGSYPHYPVSVARHDEVVAAAAPFVFNVVERLTQIDKTSWPWLSQNGSPEELLAFLDRANLYRLDLGEIAWRMQERDSFKQIVARLEARHLYHDTLWSYGIRHDDPATIRAFLRHCSFADRCGLYLVSPLLDLKPVERLTYQHLEYAPLVNPRTHQLGPKRTILNNALREQYQRLLKVLSYKAALTDPDELAVAYYLTLQDRVAEALDWYARVDRTAVPEQLQCDYLAAYLALYRGDVATARQLAQAHATEGVDRWRNRFAQVLNYLDEIRGGAAAAANQDDRDQAQGTLAATEPALELAVEAGSIRLDYRNLQGCTLNFYPMDIELLFSRSPFLQDGAEQCSFIRPVASQSVEFTAGQDTCSVELPKEFRTKNVMVEAVAAGLRHTQAYYANTLKVQMIEAYGQLAVTHAESRQPVPAVYVKIYAKFPRGEVKFFKDGYTDLRGRFDYASLNTDVLDRAERLALLILSDQFGAVVREAAPPKR